MNKLMSLGVDCSTGFIFGKDKQKDNLDINKAPEIKEYEIGLFDWAWHDCKNPLLLLKYNYVNYCLQHNLYRISIGNENNSQMSIILGYSDENSHVLNYSHVPLKNSIEESICNYKSRLNYLYKKTFNHYQNGGNFIVSFIEESDFGDEFIISFLDNFCEYKIGNSKLYVLMNRLPDEELVYKKSEDIKILNIPKKYSGSLYNVKNSFIEIQEQFLDWIKNDR